MVLPLGFYQNLIPKAGLWRKRPTHLGLCLKPCTLHVLSLVLYPRVLAATCCIEHIDLYRRLPLPARLLICNHPESPRTLDQFPDYLSSTSLPNLLDSWRKLTDSLPPNQGPWPAPPGPSNHIDQWNMFHSLPTSVETYCLCCLYVFDCESVPVGCLPDNFHPEIRKTEWVVASHAGLVI